MLEHAQKHAGRARFRRGELWVIADNARAISAYERAGWGGDRPRRGARVRGTSGTSLCPELRLIASAKSSKRPVLSHRSTSTTAE
ncbi:N-acetyltransferase [Kineococcus sp. SYSU DK003]|uniref:hypothetical protein n=1 Tax=Kineococcus sp. SYSU DK003 TaxID=3383124 RepID=UPI003D7ED363